MTKIKGIDNDGQTLWLNANLNWATLESDAATFSDNFAAREFARINHRNAYQSHRDIIVPILVEQN